jgi:hypothetical protein
MTELFGRDAVVRRVTSELEAGRSVLLFGPEAIGKSAIVAAAARDGVEVIDPFERITPQQAYRMRRALDRGAVYLGASRVARGRELGAVGRILWRFSLVRVRELPNAVLGRVVLRELEGRGSAAGEADAAWVPEIVALARGRPGFAVAMARFAADWRRAHGYLAEPAFAFAAVREEAVIGGLPPAGPRAKR